MSDIFLDSSLRVSLVRSTSTRDASNWSIRIVRLLGSFVDDCANMLFWGLSSIGHSSEHGAMIAHLVSTLRMCRVEVPPLTRFDHCFLALNHVGVIVALCTCNSNLVMSDIKDKLVLSHQSATNHDLLLAVDIRGQTILTSVLPVEVLAWVPVKLVGFARGTRVDQEAKNGIRHEVFFGSLRVRLLVVGKAEQASRAIVISDSGAVVLRIRIAEHVEVESDH